jgi:hypothetical protein
MLHKDKKIMYYVYPSWAQLSYKWEDLPRLMSDPLASGYLDPRHDWLGLGYPERIQPFQLIDGPVGGGIVVAHKELMEKWLPAAILGSEADLAGPRAMSAIRENYNVCYLDPRDEPGWELGLGKKQKYYPLGASAEHVESMPDSIFWLVGFRPGKNQLPGLDDVVGSGKHFGFQVERLDSPPPSLRDETGHWLNSKYEYAWFGVQGGGDGFGYHFAVLLYIGYHLCVVAGRRMAFVHLLASIEGKPNPYSGHLVGGY